MGSRFRDKIMYYSFAENSCIMKETLIVFYTPVMGVGNSFSLPSLRVPRQRHLQNA